MEATEKKQLTQEEIELIAQRGETTKFDNEGNQKENNRAERRRKLPKLRIRRLDRVFVPDNALTKATHSIKLARAKSKKAYRKTH